MERQTLPNANTAMILGIISIVTCCCYGVIGLPLGIVALVLANKAIKLDAENPETYTGVKNAKTGKILGIIGIVINILTIVYFIWILNEIGWDALGNPELLQERAKELQGM